MGTAILNQRELDVLEKYLTQLDPSQPVHPNALKAIKESGLKLLNAYKADAKVIEKVVIEKPKAKTSDTKKQKPKF